MKLALCQIDPVVADFDGNAALILKAAREAAAQDPDLVVFPELALCGYPPMDLLAAPGFADAQERAFRALQRELPRGLAVAFGHVSKAPHGSERALANSLSVILDGRVVFSQDKSLLPTYDVFDEARYFEPAKSRSVFEYRGRRVGFAICEDLWRELEPMPGASYALDPPRELLDLGADLIVVPSASPYQLDKLALRVKLCAELASEGAVPVAYCNMAGANDSLVFDGRSFLVDKSGELRALGAFGEGTLVVDTDAPGGESKSPAMPHRYDELEAALTEGIRGYMRKCGFKTAVLGLSGGIDSAVVAVLAARAIGAENLTCITMPSRYSSEGSVTHSQELCDKLGCRLENISIEGPFSAYLETLKPAFAGRQPDLTEENLQARIRGDLLMAWSNKFGSMLLTTGNKSELAVGYCTLYGDMCGALAPIGDVLKTEVFALSERMYERDGVMPRSIIDKPPSAELRPNQLDQDSLPPYDALDAILRPYIERDADADAIAALGGDPELIRKILKLVARSEFKRRQAAPVIKVSPRAFGIGRRLPMARRTYEAD